MVVTSADGTTSTETPGSTCSTSGSSASTSSTSSSSSVAGGQIVREAGHSGGAQSRVVKSKVVSEVRAEGRNITTNALHPNTSKDSNELNGNLSSASRSEDEDRNYDALSEERTSCRTFTHLHIQVLEPPQKSLIFLFFFFSFLNFTPGLSENNGFFSPQMFLTVKS